MTPLDTLTEIAAHGLTRSSAFPAEPLGIREWEVLAGRVRSQRVPGFLAHAIHQGSFPATEWQAEQAYGRHAASMALCLELERGLLRVVGLLDAAGIDHRVLKGPAFAHLVYPDPSLRSFGDIDLLVPGERFDEAVKVLLEAGCRRKQPQIRAGFDRRFGKGTTLVAEDGHEVDLHRTLAAGRFGLRIESADLFATASPFSLAGRPVLALGPDERLLHACYHAALGNRPPRLLALRDVAQMALVDELDCPRLLRRAEAWSGQAVIARAVCLAWWTFGLADVTPLSVWAGRYQPTPGESRAMRAYTTDHSGGAQAITAFRAVGGLRDKAAFLRAMAVPERAFLEGRTGGRYTRWWARGLRSAVRIGRRA